MEPFQALTIHRQPAPGGIGLAKEAERINGHEISVSVGGQ